MNIGLDGDLRENLHKVKTNLAFGTNYPTNKTNDEYLAILIDMVLSVVKKDNNNAIELVSAEELLAKEEMINDLCKELDDLNDEYLELKKENNFLCDKILELHGVKNER